MLIPYNDSQNTYKILCKYVIHHSPMLKYLLVLKQTLEKTNKRMMHLGLKNITISLKEGSHSISQA